MEDFPTFEPQNKIQNLQKEIESIAAKTHSYITYRKIDEEKDWYPYVEDICRKMEYVCGPKFCLEDAKDITYKWTQTDNYFQIVMTDVPKESITIDEHHISSPKLSGDWLWPVKDITVDVVGSITQIEFNTTENVQWPLLIKGGNPDGLSCFYLALVANQSQKQDIALYYMQRGTMANNHNCAMAYALSLLEDASQEECVHWFARAVLNHADNTCGYLLSAALLDGRGIEPAPQLAEYILCRLCVEGFADAFTRLGILYLRGALGVKKAPKQAQQLLALAAYQYHDETAEKIYEATPWDQLISDQEKQAEEEKKKIEEEEKHKDDPGVSDYLIAGGVVAGLIGAGIWAFNKFSKK
ncbi:hypothetical protein TVAG_329330 [Trichomonas vaginalis G3]|uniref:Sel1 repeat family protein n=1 Tax=Trichomonas vaginalis (strain ATCC PRA-98 / G3) TaxID=412133 RepID=A2EBA1_TRIV3|nr:tetratricopeptide repeat domain domain-containing protein [Trichomonas vaginalis G3]EAY10046.1 hypothetical protein TVAG_329330 [Trichomonas vaginalis G3]KAI5528504.1 tetratricopeptide repeat domain domain-containing protein [Trichomonas vaginalis G3]|eukprot:XP_001322269.1 hypothetical protein [Trichomonas vaginalis G3]